MNRTSGLWRSIIALGLSALTLQSAVVAQADCVTPPSGLVGWWKGDGDTSDSLGGNNGVAVNSRYTNGVVGQAFSFDPGSFAYGTYTGVQIADRPAYALTNALTIEGWVRPRGPGYYVFFRGDNRPGLDPYGLSMQGNNDLEFQICDQNGNGASVGTTVAYNVWTHVAAVLDGSTGTMSIYTNGVLANQTVTRVRPFGALIPGDSPGVGIGNLNDGFNNFPFTGDIDEIALYNRALSAPEIQSIYNAGSAGKCTSDGTTNSCDTPPAGLVSWWPAEGNANDVVGINNGSLEGGATFAPGKVGLGFRFDGTNGYVQIPDANSLKPTNVTVEAWVWLDPNLPSGRGGEQIIFKKNTWSAWFEGYSLLKWTRDNGDGTYTDYFQFCVSSHGNQVAINSQTIARRGVWYHVAATYDGNQSILYVNGVAEASATPGFALDYDTTPVFIGTSGTWPPYLSMFGGILDEVSIYNRALNSNEITAIYAAGSAGKCDNASGPSEQAVPAIFNFTPVAGTNGTVVTIAGTNFSANASSNIVCFGAVQAAVLSANPTNLTVAVPVGATYAPVTVTVNGLVAYAGQPFEPTFLGAGTGISPASFGPRLDLPAGNNPLKVVIADLDGDGKPDLIVADVFGHTISLYRNISTGGTLTVGSFAPRVDLPTPSGSYSPFGLAVADVDGDGKLDIVVSDYNDSLVSVFRNTCTPGNISTNTFATRVDFATGNQPQGVEVRDMDGDGKPDLLVANAGDGTVSILRNTGVAGSLTTNSFAAKVDFITGSGCQSVVTGDLDGDGKPDVVTADSGSGTVSVLRNISSPGNLAFEAKADLAVPDGPVQMAIGDLDGDGKPDLTVACYLPQTLSVFRNASTVGSLTTNSFASRIDYPLGGRGHTPVIADLDGDGKPDLAVVTELDSMLSIFGNVSTPGSFTAGSLAPRVDFSSGWNAWGVAVGDLDGDGRPDVVFANQYDSTITIYQNQTPFSGPPLIQTQPSGQTVVEGSSANLSVAAVGAPPLSYQWTVNGTVVLGATNSTLTLMNLHPNQAGNYQVKVTNTYGAVTSSNAVLFVTEEDILIYTYSGNEKITTGGAESSYAYSGRMFFLPDSTNGTFIGWATIGGKKQYWVSPFSDYLLATISGSQHRVYTLLGKAGDEIDANGQPHLWSYLHKGQNETLNIGSKKHLSFPKTFSCDDNHFYPDPQTGNLILREATSTYTFAPQNTQTANNTGQTLADLVSAQIQSLVNQGYQKQ